MAKISKSNYKLVNRTIKFISISFDHKIVGAIFKNSPDTAIRAICNEALNPREGDVVLTLQLKQFVSRYHKHFDRLTDVQYPIKKKRALCIQQEGLLPIIPAILGSVLGSLNSEFISRIFNKNE